MSRRRPARPLAALAVPALAAPILTVPLLLAGCASTTASGQPTPSGNTAGLTATAQQEQSAASALQGAAQAVQQAPTLGQLESAVSELADDLQQAQPIAPAGSSGTQAQWQQALAQLQQAAASLQKLTGASSGGYQAPSPLKTSSSSSQASKDQVGTIIDDLNKGYDLLSKVGKDLAKLGSTPTTTTGGGANPSGGSRPGTYTLTINVPQNQQGSVYVANYGVGQAINCGSAGGACSSAEPEGTSIGVSVQGDPTGNGTWTIKSVSGPQGCNLTPTAKQSDYDCALSRYSNTTVNVEFSPPSTQP